MKPDLLQANIEALARGESETGVAEAMISVTRGSETIENDKGEKLLSHTLDIPLLLVLAKAKYIVYQDKR